MNLDFYRKCSFNVSGLFTKKYSTSFSLATSLLEKEKRNAIYATYGFVRIADEIVDSFHGYDKAFLLDKLYEDLNYALEKGISTNPLLICFADTVKKYQIDQVYIDAFMASMRADISKTEYSSKEEIQAYIYGSADVVGLMCLRIFCNGNNVLFDELKEPAQRLGSAFQKVNFLRDLKADVHQLGRNYFPELMHAEFNANSKQIIEDSIEADFKEAYKGVKGLPGRSKLAVALAYFYYYRLFMKIKRTSPKAILSERIRISNGLKYLTIFKVMTLYKLRLI